MPQCRDEISDVRAMISHLQQKHRVPAMVLQSSWLGKERLKADVRDMLDVSNMSDSEFASVKPAEYWQD